MTASKVSIIHHKLTVLKITVDINFYRYINLLYINSYVNDPGAGEKSNKIYERGLYNSF